MTFYILRSPLQQGLNRKFKNTTYDYRYIPRSIFGIDGTNTSTIYNSIKVLFVCPKHQNELQQNHNHDYLLSLFVIFHVLNDKPLSITSELRSLLNFYSANLIMFLTSVGGEGRFLVRILIPRLSDPIFQSEAVFDINTLRLISVYQSRCI